MTDLTLQRKDVIIIIDFPIHRDLKEFEVDLNGLMCSWCYIVHDKDTYSTDDVIPSGKNIGDLKTKHIHLLLSFPKRHQLKYYLRLCCDYLSINENQVSIKPCDSVPGAVQYWIHKNNPNKYQYSVVDLHTNINEGLISDYLNEDLNIKFSTQDIIDICIESKGRRLYIIQKIGIQRYTLYRNTINDIYKSLCYVEDRYVN